MHYWKNTFIKYLICLAFVFGVGLTGSMFNNAHDAVLGFLFSIPIAFLVLHLGTAFKRWIMRLFTRIPQDPDDAIKYIIYEKDFLIDLSKVIEDEGGIYMFLKKVKTKSKPSLHTDDTNDSLIFQGGYKSKYWMENVSSAETPDIIDKIISTNSVDRYLTKYDMRDWKSYFGNHIFLFITQSDFQQQYAKLLSDAGLDTRHARREMTDEEKNIFWDIDTNKKDGI